MAEEYIDSMIDWACAPDTSAAQLGTTLAELDNATTRASLGPRLLAALREEDGNAEKIALVERWLDRRS